VLASWTLAYFASLLPIGAHFDRYVLPLIPALAVLAARYVPLAAVLLLLLVVPLTWTIQSDRELVKTDTRMVAAREYFPLRDAGGLALDPSLPVPERGLLFELALPAPWAEPDPLRDLNHLRAQGVRIVVLTGAIEDRVLEAPDRYPREAAFLADVRRTRLLFRIDPNRELAGPWVEAYAVG
jgi:hypothetical protein